jgi:primosomal protein N' (replication factor Y) (superfamily II helicase)
MADSHTYIEVAVALPVYQTFAYCVPIPLRSQVSPGIRVLVPFGRRTVTGYVLGDGEAGSLQEVKHILDVLDSEPLFPESMLDFFRWVSDYYIYPIGEVIKCALPGGLTVYDQTRLEITTTGDAALQQVSLTPVERRLLRRLQAGPKSMTDIRSASEDALSLSLIHVLENRGWLIKKRELRGGRTKPKMERYVSLSDSGIPDGPFSPARKKLFEALNQRVDMPIKQLRKIVPTASSIIRSLETGGYVSTFQKRVYRDPFGESIASDIAPTLNEEQKKAVGSVIDTMGKGFSTYLLTGVTGSGKTEVYLSLAAEAMAHDVTVLVLVPEIALMAQMERRFRARFGDCIAVLHSGLSAGERFDQWMRIRHKEAGIVIGARSAIFAPAEKIGLIIVDEEHDTSYKQESGLRYNARDLAVVRAKLNGGVALLGSATPSVQSCHNVDKKKFAELTLTRRIDDRPLAEIIVVDLCKNRDASGTGRFISSELYQEMKQTLSRGEQALLFLNRRGYASFPVCGACGEAVRCKNCDISLTLHQGDRAYKCHYCGFTRASVSRCDTCGSSNIKLLGMGTEKIEAAAKELFPEARVARMDRDTTVRKGSLLGLLKGLRNRTIDLLVGTQIIAKGHDFPNITLVGIICADLSLSFPDFRAGERTFQILAQVAGRAGRGKRPGKVILQTYNPNHFCIESARKQDFRSFYEKEIKFRKSLTYPPFSRMIHLKISGKDRQKVRQYAIDIGGKCRLLKNSSNTYQKSIEIMGPIEAPLPRIAGRFRWQILCKGSTFNAVHGFTRRLMSGYSSLFNQRSVKVVVDVDPVLMM